MQLQPRSGRLLIPIALLFAAPAGAQNWLSGPRYLSSLDQNGANDEYGELISRGDVDGDGDVDLVAAVSSFDGTQTSYGLRALLNDGGGEFAQGPHSTVLFSDQSLGLPLADLTADGVLDLVLRNALATGPLPTIEVLPGLGGGAFGAPYVLATGGNGLAAAIGDCDADGDLDVAQAHTGAGISTVVEWWRFDVASGAGFIATPGVTVSSGLSGPGLNGLAALDLEGDGDADLVTTEFSGGKLHVLVSVAGSPVAGPIVDTGVPPSSVFLSPRAGDLDGDGDADLLLHGFDSGAGFAVQAVENLGGGALATGALQTFEKEPVDPGQFQELADWDADGDLDLLLAGATPESTPSSTVLCLTFLENADLDFAVAAHAPTLQAIAGAGAADYDGDGHLDWASSKTLVHGTGLIEESLPRLGHYAFTDDFGAFDWEGDGDLDLAELRLGFHLNRGDRIEFDPFFPSIQPPAGFSYDDGAGLADFNGDGWADYLVGYFTNQFFVPTFVEMRLLAGSAAGIFVDAGIAAPSGEKIAPPAAGSDLVVDLDLDGDLDLLRAESPAVFQPALGGLRENDGSGFFTFDPLLGAATPFAWGDADADGDPDVLAGPNAAPQELDLMRNLGGAVFATEPIGTGLAVARFHDLDGDGDGDVIAHGTGPFGTDQTVRLFESQPGATVPAGVLASELFSARIFGLEDLDADGVLDLVGAGRPQKNGSGTSPILTHAEVWRGLGGGFAYEAPRRYVGPETEGFADLDQDGDLDAYGSAVMESLRLGGRIDGQIHEYGAGIVGTGDVVPVLGGSGPIAPGAPGSSNAALHVRRGLGGALALFAIGTQEVAFTDTPFAGFTVWVDPLLVIVPVALGGAAGVAGEGTFDFDVSGLLPIIAGQTYTHQFAIVDPVGPSGFTSTNGLRHTYGL